MSRLFIVLLSVCVPIIYCEKVATIPCTRGGIFLFVSLAKRLLITRFSADFGTATLHEVRISPCPEASKRRPCLLRKGTEVAIEVDFAPSTVKSVKDSSCKLTSWSRVFLAVAADKIVGRAYWASRVVELPMPGMNTNACDSLNCPMAAGNNQTYRYTLPVSRSFPNVSACNNSLIIILLIHFIFKQRRYDVKWRLNSGDFNMCFQFPIQIVN